MSDALKLALRISAIDLFSGVLRRFEREVVGTGAAAKAMQRDYDNLVKHTASGLKALAVGGYLAEKMKPAISAAADFQDAWAKNAMVLQGAAGQTAHLNDQMKRLVDNAYSVSNATKGGLMFPASQIMNVQEQLVQAMVPIDAIVDRVDKQGRVHRGGAYMIDLLAETKKKDPGWVTMQVENLAHEFQYSPKDYGQIADIVAKASVLGTGTLESFFYNMDQAGAVAHNFGHMSLQQTAIVMKDLAPYGESAGNEFNSFMMRLMGASFRGAKWMAKSGLDFYDKKGKFIGWNDALLQISDRYGAGKVPEQVFNERLGRAFGAEGIKVLGQLLAPSAPGTKSYAEMVRAFPEQAGLIAQNEVRAQTLNFQMTKFGSGLTNLETSAFGPLTESATHVTKAFTGIVDSVANYAHKHSAFDKIVSGTAAAGLSIAGLAALYHGGRAAGSAGKLLKGLMGKGKSVVGGVAEGIAIEKITGVTPVFVTNWPGSSLPAAPSAAATAVQDGEEVAAAGGVGALLRRVLGKRLLSLGPEWAEVGAGGAGSAAVITGAGIAGAGLGGYVIGHEINKHFIEPNASLSDKIGGTIATVLASFGDKTAEAALDQHFKALAHQQSQMLKVEKQPAKLEGTFHIQLDQPARARITQAKTNQPNVHVDVGTMLGVP